MAVPSTETIIRALENRYPSPARTLPPLTTSQLRDILRALQTNFDVVTLPPETDNSAETDKSFSTMRILPDILANCHEHALPATEFAILSSIDDCITLALRLAMLHPEITALVRPIVPLLSHQILQYPGLPLSNTASSLDLLDNLTAALIGWVPGLGRSGDNAYEQFKGACLAAAEPDSDLAAIIVDVGNFLEKENRRIEKLETRLANAETGVLRSKQSRFDAALMINKFTENKLLTASIARFLQDPWFDSVQLLYLSYGIESEQWQRAVKITETIVWVYQPLAEGASASAADKQKLYRIIEHLPNEIRELLVALEHNSERAEEAVESFERELVQLVAGESLAFEKFSPIPIDSQFGHGSKVSRLLLKKVDGYQAGQWFSFEEDNRSTRIKLVLKLEDLKQLVFTNRNGMKVMEKSFSEFAYYLSSGALRPLNKDRIFSSTFIAHYEGLVAEHERQTKLYEERKAEFDRLDAQRKAASQKAAKEAQDLAETTEQAKLLRIKGDYAESLAAAKSAFGKEENAEVVAEIIARIQALHVGNWVRLPGPDDKIEDCKLAVRLTSADKMIFVNRAGLKLGEYTTREIAQIVLAGHGDIQVENVEFEDTLAQVVTKLRQDRNKSYDDLTGG